MFVLLDMEWIESRIGYRSLTQLYAARVDEKWNTIRAFDALVCPRDPGTAPWEHLAFNGYAPAEFCASDSEKSCVQRFFRWLQPDDVICCWHVETKNTLKALYRRYLFGTFSATVRYMNQKVYDAIVAMVFSYAAFAARAPAIGNSADRAWQLSQLVEGVLTAFNPSHGSLSCVQAEHCVSKQIGRHDTACQDCPWGVSRSPEAHCFRVVARTVRFSQPALLSALLVIQLFGIVIPPPYFS